MSRVQDLPVEPVVVPDNGIFYVFDATVRGSLVRDIDSPTVRRLRLYTNARWSRSCIAALRSEFPSARVLRDIAHGMNSYNGLQRSIHRTYTSVAYRVALSDEDLMLFVLRVGDV